MGRAVSVALGVASTAGLPALHAAIDRVAVADRDGWQIRRTAHDDERFAYFASHGMLHLQLWRPAGAGAPWSISILTSSALTDGQVEVWVEGRGRARTSDYRTLAKTMRAEGVAPLGPALVAALVRWYVSRFESSVVRLRRRWWGE